MRPPLSLVCYSIVMGFSLVPGHAFSQLPAPGNLDPSGRVFTKVVAKIGEVGGYSDPIAGLRLLVVTEGGDRVELRTNEAGVATAWLLPTRYRFVTSPPATWKGQTYSWDFIASVRPGDALVKLSRNNAVQTTATAEGTTSPTRIAPTLGEPAPSVDATKRMPYSGIADLPARAKDNSQSISGQTPSKPTIVWMDGTPNSDQILSKGSVVRILTHDGIAVSAAVIRNDDLLWTNVTVSNRSGRRFDVDPSTFKLEQTSPKSSSLRYRDPQEIAKSMKRRAEWGAAFFLIAGEMAKKETDTQVQSTTSGSVIGSSVTTGTIRSTVSTDEAQVRTRTDGRFNISARSSTNIHTVTPDDEARANAATQADKLTAAADAKGSTVLSIALLANTLTPGEDVGGAVFFERDKKARDVVLRLPLGGSVFEIPLTIR